jgi:putative flippase GtrA
MNDKQQEFLIWLLKFLGVGFNAALTTNLLNWLTGSDFPNQLQIVISTIMSIIGAIILHRAYVLLKEKKVWEY